MKYDAPKAKTYFYVYILGSLSGTLYVGYR